MSQTQNKIYVVEIDNAPVTQVWYRGMQGHHFDAELKPRGNRQDVGFYVGGGKFINPIHCKVVAERKINV